jgi:thioredoxin-like negative regulator of GroEL
MALHYDQARRWVLRGLAAATAIALLGVFGTYTTVRDSFVGVFDRLAEPGGILGFFHLFSWFFGLIPPYAADPMVRLTVWFGLALAVGSLLIIYVFRTRPHLELLLGLWCLMPLYPFFSHWADNEQRGHLFGYWFGHDMFTPPFKAPDGKLSYDPKLRAELMKQPGGNLIYPEMDEHTVLFGGTDPGRFNPTYMIYCESFIPASKKPHDPLFDRRDVYLITQNALADGTYLSYIRAHYNRSTQIDPYFFSELLRGPEEVRLNIETNILARLMLPIDRYFFNLGTRIEKRRRAGSSFFKESDFLDVKSFADKVNRCEAPAQLTAYLKTNLSPKTLQLLNGPADKGLARALAGDLNRLLDNEYEWNLRLPAWREEHAALTNQLATLQAENKTKTRAFAKAQQRRAELELQIATANQLIPFYKPERFAGVTLSDHLQRFVAENPQLSSRIRLHRLLLEAAFPKEIARSLGGVYPDREIRTPSNDDSQKAFQDYLADAQRRLALKQLKPGEDVRVIDNKVQVSGQVAVMAINGLLTKVIFDANPHHEFYVEESFPLDWMYPYLTPFGIIMKINRQPLADLSEEILQRDRKFWSDFSVRLVGEWITETTPVSELCAFAERVYLNRNYKGFKGDPKFVRDNDGQKAFSKLRSSIAGVYAWRYGDYGTKLQDVQRRLTAAETPPAERPALQNEFNRLIAQRQRMFREAEFAFKQAYAYCPYSPEAIFRYINLLVTEGRIDDAYQIARTSRKLDPFNPQLEGLVGQLASWKSAQPGGARPAAEAQPEIAQLEAQFRANPSNAQLAAQLVQACLNRQQTDRALAVLDQIVASPASDAGLVHFAAQQYYGLGQLPKVEQALTRLVKVSPDNPEAWYDLAGLQAMHNKETEALASLTEALRRSAERLKRDPTALNLHSNALTDQRFNALRAKPAFQKILSPERPGGG